MLDRLVNAPAFHHIGAAGFIRRLHDARKANLLDSGSHLLAIANGDENRGGHAVFQTRLSRHMLVSRRKRHLRVHMRNTQLTRELGGWNDIVLAEG